MDCILLSYRRRKKIERGEILDDNGATDVYSSSTQYLFLLDPPRDVEVDKTKTKDEIAQGSQKRAGKHGHLLFSSPKETTSAANSRLVFFISLFFLLSSFKNGLPIEIP